MTKRKGPGRPRLPKGEAKGAVVALRFTKDERRELDVAAKIAGQTLSQWARSALLKTAASGPA